MSENIDLISKENISDCRKNENDIISNLQNNYIYKLLKVNGFNNKKLSVIFESEICSSSNKNELNILCRKIKKHNNITISDIIIYLEKFTDIKKIINVFDAETKWILKVELSEKYNIKLKTNKLYEIIG